MKLKSVIQITFIHSNFLFFTS